MRTESTSIIDESKREADQRISTHIEKTYGYSAGHRKAIRF